MSNDEILNDENLDRDGLDEKDVDENEIDDDDVDKNESEDDAEDEGRQVSTIDYDQLAMIRVSLKCLPTILAALNAAGFKQDVESVEEFSRQYTDEEANANRLEWLERAEEQRGEDGETEFRPDGLVWSHHEDAYVMGWLFVQGDSDDDVDEDEPDDESGADEDDLDNDDLEADEDDEDEIPEVSLKVKQGDQKTLSVTDQEIDGVYILHDMYSEHLVPIEELAQNLDVSKRTLLKWFKNGQVPIRPAILDFDLGVTRSGHENKRKQR